jgi:hypothetical protein
LRAEHVTWPDGGTPPRGTYKVRADCWAACSEVQTSYIVTVNIQGQNPQVFSGTFNAADQDHGGVDAGRPIATINY